MQPREAFGVMVRSLGLFGVCYALWNLGFAFSDAIGFTARPDVSAREYVAGMVTFMAIGIALLCGADSIVRYAYGRE